MDTQTRNAVAAGKDLNAPARAVVVAGNARQAAFWTSALTTTVGGAATQSISAPTVVWEQGRKGNFLGTLQAYQRALRAGRVDANIDQVAMLLGSGTRLSPFTQALGNMKSALPLPSVRGAEGIDYTLGEAAIRSASPLIDYLQSCGFVGILLRWGDEIVVPSRSLEPAAQDLSQFDVVRFGWATDPSERLATQKEWMLADPVQGLVERDLRRQPLESLKKVLAHHSELTPLVNLGSFAVNPEVLAIASEVFGPQVWSESQHVNWDPYFWMALQSPTRAEWDSMEAAELSVGLRGLAELNAALPEFYENVQTIEQEFRRRRGRGIRVGVLDFGEPYWLDGGSHSSLRTFFDDLFLPRAEGSVARALMGVPDTLAEGGSAVVNSELPRGMRMSNSLVLGARIEGSESSLAGAIVVGGAYGTLNVSRGGVCIQCSSESLTVAGPRGVGFRVEGRGVVGAGEALATVRVGGKELRLRYDEEWGPIDEIVYSSKMPGNEVSFRRASTGIEVDANANSASNG